MVLPPRVPKALYVHTPQFVMEMYGKYFIDRITDGSFITHHNHIVVYCACCVHAQRDVAELTNVFHNAMMSIVIMICVTMAYFDIYVHSMCSFLFPVCLCLVCVCLSQHMCVMCVCVSYVHSMIMLPHGRAAHTPQRSWDYIDDDTHW